MLNFDYIRTVLQKARAKRDFTFRDKNNYLRLLRSNTMLNYFRRYYPLVELDGVRKFLSRSKFYSSTHINKIAEQVARSRELFLENLSNAKYIYNIDWKINVSESDLVTLDKLLRIKLLPYFTEYDWPSLDEVLDQIKFKASSGLPEP
jgi:hypothetical protein